MKTVKKIRTLNHIKRCSQFPVFHPTSVSEHSFHVAVITLFLVEEMRNQGNDIDELSILKRALLHDVEEIVLSDIPYPVKKYLKKNINKALKAMLKESMPETPKWLVDYMLGECDGSLEWRIVKAADMLELIHYCEDEIGLGNNHVRSMLLTALDVIKEHNIYLESNYLKEIIFGIEEKYGNKT